MEKIKKYPSQEACTGITLTPELLNEVDRIREDLPRSVFIRRALIRYLDELKKGNVALPLQNLSSVTSPESPAEIGDSSLRDNNNHQHPVREEVIAS